MRRARALAVLVAVALPLATGAFWTGGTGQSARGMPPPVSVSSEVPTPAFSVEVRGRRVRSLGRRARPTLVREALEGVRETMTRLYAAGFVDAAGRGPVRPTDIEDLFARDALEKLPEDLDGLTLGSDAPRFTRMRSRHAAAFVRLLAARGGRPMLAVATVDLAAKGLSADGPVPVEHRGRYVLRPLDGRWRIVSYHVTRRLPAPGEYPRLSAVPQPRQPRAARARVTPKVPSRGRLFLLVIGSDARPGERVDRLRADSIHIVGVNPKRRGGAIVGIPRDSFVHIPGAGTRKINEALHIGGPRLMVKTVGRLTGIPIHGYLLTGFRGFAKLVGTVGGLRVKVPYRMNDAASGARFRPGLRRLTGNQALAFARNRYDAPGGDFGRSLNQGRLILSALRKYRKAVLRNPAAFLPWLVAGMATVRTDLSLEKVLGLMLSAPRIDPGRVKNRVVSGSGAMVGGASVVRLGPPAHRIFRDLRRDAMLRG